MYLSILNADLEEVGRIILPNHLIIVCPIPFVFLFNLLYLPFFLLFCINVLLASRQTFITTPNRYLI